MEITKKQLEEIKGISKNLGKKELIEELFTYDDSNTPTIEQLMLNALRLKHEFGDP